MNLRHLRYFATVAEELHFGRAAARLHMAQPPLSQAIRRLESEVGADLFERTTRRVALTPAGQAYLESARSILAAVDKASHTARRVAAGSVGHLTIGCVGSATYSMLPGLSRRLAAELPGIDFSFRGELLAPDQIAGLRDGTIDVALLRPPVSDPGIVAHRLRHDHLVVALPADHPLSAADRVTPADLAGADLIVHSAERRSVMHGVVIRLLHEAGVEPNVRHEVGETSTLVTLVAGGLGVAIVPEPVTALALTGVTYRPLSAPDAGIDLLVAHRAGRSEPHLGRAVGVVRAFAER